jgi:hypothetical protein
MEIINSVAEYTPLHRFFINVMDTTPLHSEKYQVDLDELCFILDAYMSNIDLSKPYFVLKMPFYPFTCLEFLSEYFGQNPSLIFCDRPTEKVIKSYNKRDEDKWITSAAESVELVRQVKKLGVNERQQFLSNGNSSTYFEAMVNRCKQLRDVWNHKHKDNPFITIDVEQVSTSPEHLSRLLTNLGLNSYPLHNMLSITDKQRLIHNQQPLAS